MAPDDFAVNERTTDAEPAARDQLPEGFWEALKKKYLSDPNSRAAWEVEEQALRTLIPQVAASLPNVYRIEQPIGLGGSGVVVRIEDTNLRAKRALKISRPSPGKELILARVLLSETESLRRLSHQNLIRIFAQGNVTLNGRDCPYYVMDFVEGVSEADHFLAKPGATQEQLLGLLHGVLLGIEYLHEQDTIHMDLKPGNILVAKNGIPIISDLGFAKQLRVAEGQTLIGGTDGYIHPEARRFVLEAQSDPRRLQGQADRASLKQSWDLYSLGKTFLALLKVFNEHNPRSLTTYARRYLTLLSCRLLDGQNNEDERSSGISLSTFREIKYLDVRQARVDLEKLVGSYNLEARIPELNLYVQDSIQVSTVATTPFTLRVRKLLDDPKMMRLGSVSQLGLLNLIYPTATHSRLEHSLGTFSILCRYILALYNDPLNPLFRQLMDEADLRAALLAALLHDVGQYPLAHDLEEADPGFSHEEMTMSILEDAGSSFCAIIRSKDYWDVDPNRVIGILKADVKSLRGTLKDRILHSLINGPIDADKVDYLMRDSRHLGLSYGEAIDLDRLLRCLTVVFHEQNEQTYAMLGIHEKGKVPAEVIAFVRYVMFAQVYWHHAYRAIKAMLHRMVWEMFFPTPVGAKVPSTATRIRSDFKRFILGTDPSERSLFSTEELASNLNGDLCQILPKDLAVLRWVAERTSTVGKELFEMLRSRRLFKRVLVLSRDKAQDKEVWGKVNQFYSDSNRKPKLKLRLQVLFQQKVVTLVDKGPAANPSTLVVNADSRNAFLAARERAILLIDFAPKRRGSDTPLEFIIEEDRRLSKLDTIHVKSLEHSVVWEALQRNFHESIGKLRVFCHPEHSDFLSAYVSRQALEQALEDALTIVERERDKED